MCPECLYVPLPKAIELLGIRFIFSVHYPVGHSDITIVRIWHIEINHNIHILHHTRESQSQCFDQIRFVLITFIINGRVCDINNLMSLARTKGSQLFY